MPTTGLGNARALDKAAQVRRQLQANPRPQRPSRLLLQVRRCNVSQEAVLKAAEGLRAALERPAKVSSTPPLHGAQGR